MSRGAQGTGRVASALVIDDDDFMRDLLHEMLENMGVARVGLAADGAEALERLQAGAVDRPDILICDLAMPAMDGIEFLRHLATLDFAGGIVLLSGTSPRILYAAEQLGRAHGLRMLGILEKPVCQTALQEVLGQFENRPERERSEAPHGSLTAQEIRAGLERGYLAAYFQPKVAVATRQVVGVECLARWRDPVRGVLPPSAFIGVAEQAGLIGDITSSVFRQAVRCAGEWQRRGCSLRININLSGDDVCRLDLPELLSGWAAEAGVANENLVLELTESRLMSDRRLNLDIITRLRLKQFGLSIDDFGTGYSTLDKLKSLPFTELKIDRAFVNGAAGDTTARAILESSVHLGRALGLSLVAEGVETQEDWDVVARLGIDEVQGYFIARPMNAEELLDWKSDWEGKSTVDLDRLRGIVGGDPAVHARVLEKFLHVARQNLDDLAAARRSGAPAIMGALGHKLKSGARSIGAQLLADACQALEDAGNEGDLPRCERLVDAIERHFKPVADVLEAKIGSYR